MRLPFAFLLLSLLSTPVVAEQRWYQIELLVFANNSSQGLISEHWRAPAAFTPQAYPGLPSLDEMIVDSAYAFEAVSDTDKQLVKNLEKMNQHWQYRPLLYSSWRQRFTRDAAAIPVHLNNQTIIREADSFAQTAHDLSSRFGGAISSDEAPTEELEPLYEVSGTAAVTLKRYLHLELELDYNRLLSDKDTDQVRAIYQSLAADYLTFQIKETRRMRSKQVHYFDHPAFGVLALITPVEDKPNGEKAEIETLPLETSDTVETTPSEQ